MPSPRARDRLRPGQDARAAGGGLTVLNPAGSVPPPGVHRYTNAELVTDPGTLWFTGDATGAYVYRFPYAMSNWDEQTVTIPAPAEATRWGVAQHFWLLRGTADLGLNVPADWPVEHGSDAHSVWDSRADPDTSEPEMTISGHFGGWGTLDMVYVVVEVNAEHPKPDGATIDFTGLLAVLDTLIAAPTVFTNTLTATYTPAGDTEPVTETGYNAHLVPYTTGALMTVRGNQFTNPITVTVDGTPATGVRILEYEADNQPDGDTGVIDTPGRVRFFAPPHAPAANDDDTVTVTVSTAHGDNSSVWLTYVDPDLFTHLSGVSPNHLADVNEPATITITGSNLDANGFWIYFATDIQTFPEQPSAAPITFGGDFLTSISETEAVLAYPFTDGSDTYTLDPGMTYHIFIDGTYYRTTDTGVDLTTGGTPLPDALFAAGDESGVTDVDAGTPISLGTVVYFATAGTVTGIQYFFPATPAGTYTGALYRVDTDDDGTAEGTLLGSVDFDTTDAGAQWVTADFATPIAVLDHDDGVYRAVVYSSAGGYTKREQSFMGWKASARNYIQAPTNGYTHPGVGVLYNGTTTMGSGLAYPNVAAAGDSFLVGVTFQPS